MDTLLATQFRYQAWANRAFLEKLEVDPAPDAQAALQDAFGLMNHIYAVADIFAAHLTGRPHRYRADRPDPLLALPALRSATEELDQWYVDYAGRVSAADLAQQIRFSFTDGDRGCLTRQEMLSHVLLHGGYHRGEVGSLLKQQTLPVPWDTFAVFLHQQEPERREAL